MEEGSSFNDDATAAPYELEERKEDAWLDAYKNLMNKTIRTFYALLASKSWKPIADSFVDAKMRNPVLLFDCDKNTAHGYYTLKAQAILPVRPERLMFVIRDHNPDTRLAWDNQYVKDCKELDCFATEEGDIKVVSTRVTTGIPLLSDRFNMGIAWYGYDDKTQSYKYVFRSTQHKMHKCPKDAVNVISLMGVFVKTLDASEDTTDPPPLLEMKRSKISELFIVVYVNPGDSFPSTIANGICKEWLRDRVRLYEKVAGEGWETYYGNKKK